MSEQGQAINVTQREQALRMRVFERMTATLSVLGLLLLLAWIPSAISRQVFVQIIFFVVMYGLVVLAWRLKKFSFTVRVLVVLSLLLLAGAYVLFQNGLVGAGRIWLMMVPLVAALLLGRTGFTLMTVVSALIYVLAAFLITQGQLTLLQAENPIDVGSWAVEALVPLGSLLLIGVMILDYRLTILRTSAEAQMHADEARAAQAIAREEAARAQRQADRMDRAATLARTITRMQDPEELIWRLVQELTEVFELYHANIFLVKAQGELLSLRAAAGERGMELVQAGWELQIGDNELPAQVAQSGREDAMVLAMHPRLPEARAEAAFPLLFRGENLGVLDLYTLAPSFTPEDLRVLRIVADQVAATLNTLQLLRQTEARAQELRNLYAQYSAESWATLLEDEQAPPQHAVGTTPPPQVQLLAREVMATGNARVEKSEVGHLLVVPLVSREIALGYLAFVRETARGGWDAETLTLVDAAAERLAVALDMVRLILTSRRRAFYEEQLGRFGDLIWASPRVEAIMERSVRELGRMLGASDVALYITPPAEEGEGTPGTGPLPATVVE